MAMRNHVAVKQNPSIRVVSLVASKGLRDSPVKAVTISSDPTYL